ncbi:arsenic resistance protein [Halomonas sp. NO4]|uniref:arsenic resistance protein n=1 Tax=Halomonas sp. NO4 TaxID=2484813 RepID=UPI0013D29A50|nr:arsenic resistance protein [Halomonas sp. NO4]
MRERLEQYQVLIYLAAILAGVAVGTHAPAMAEWLAAAIWPLLGALLYATFTQVPLIRLRAGLAKARFLAAAVLGNFVVIPLIVWGLVQGLPADPGLRLGVMLVLLLPCTDWFLSFTYLGGGDTPTAIAFTPLSLLLQLALLPLYLWLFLGQAALAGLAQRELLLAFGGLILVPLALAFVTECWVQGDPRRQRWVEALGWLPVPLLALVLFAVAAGQVGSLAASLGILGRVAPLFVAFLAAAVLLARLLAAAFRLPVDQGRVLAFSFGSRNSFVVLPLALALPAGFESAVVVVVLQSLVELAGMLVFLQLVPRWLFPLCRSS